MPSYQTACGAFDILNHVLDNLKDLGRNMAYLLKALQEK